MIKRLIFFTIYISLFVFAAKGHGGAYNLLTAWELFSLACACVIPIGVVVFEVLSLSKTEHDQKTKEGIAQLNSTLLEVSKFGWMFWVDVFFIICYAYFGWWFLFSLAVLEKIIVKVSTIGWRR